MCFNSRYAGKIHRMKRITAAQIWGFNSRYAGKIHLAMHTPGNTSRVSIPAMRVRYIVLWVLRKVPLLGFQFPLCG